MSPLTSLKVSKHIAGLWQYVSTDGRVVALERERAVEYVRQHCQDREVFKLFLQSAAIAFDQVRERDQEVLEILADFALDITFNSTGKPYEFVAMNIEIRRDNPTKRHFVPAQHHFEITLMVDPLGIVVDVDGRKLANQITQRAATRII